MHPDLLTARAARRTHLQELVRLATDVPAPRWALPSPNPGWSCHDLVAHLATGDWAMHRLLHAALAGDNLTATWDAIDFAAGNAAQLAGLRAAPTAAVVVAAQRQCAATERMWEQLTEPHLRLELPHWAGGVTTVRAYLQTFAGHDRGHLDQLRTALTAGEDGVGSAAPHPR